MLGFISTFAAQAAHVQKTQELEQLKVLEMKDLLEKTNVELDAIKEVAGILYNMCQQLGAIVDAGNNGRKQEGSSFEAMLDTAIARLDLRKAGFDYEQLQGKLNTLQNELLDVQKRHNIGDTLAPTSQ